MRYLYLHGFASGAQSRKAQAFRSALGREGIGIEIPDLAAGDFEHLTITGQLRIVEQTLNNEPVILIGSSMGGYLAGLYAAAHPEVDRLVLLAPAFGFAARWAEREPSEFSKWRETGWREVFHHGDKTMRRVHYGLFEDALRHAPDPDFRQPAWIFHGIHDDVVSIGLSRAFAKTHPNAVLTELDSGHELLNVLDAITVEALPFLTS